MASTTTSGDEAMSLGSKSQDGSSKAMTAGTSDKIVTLQNCTFCNALR
jgi:hypothetical protein